MLVKFQLLQEERPLFYSDFKLDQVRFPTSDFLAQICATSTVSLLSATSTCRGRSQSQLASPKERHRCLLFVLCLPSQLSQVFGCCCGSCHLCLCLYLHIYIYAGELVLVPRFSLSRARNNTTSRARNSTTS